VGKISGFTIQFAHNLESRQTRLRRDFGYSSILN
jgi:hypothetical protein